MLNKEEIQQFNETLAQSKRIAIVSHYNPDGDAVGASLGLYHFFTNRGFEVQVILPNQYPDFLQWMPASDKMLIAQQNILKAKKNIKEADILFVVDMNAPHRSGKDLESSIIKSSAYKVLIDHHLSPEIDCNIKFSTTKTTSTCELVFTFLFNYLDAKDKLTQNIAECLYVGIITDTGSLYYACNYPNTYLILNKLIKAGVDGEAIHRKVYDNYSESRLKLLGLSLSQRMKVMPQYATSYMYLSEQDLKDYHYNLGDTEGFVNYGLSMKTVKFTAFFIERKNKIRISFRSKGEFDVNLFARKHFNGGGHKNASAAYFYDTLENTITFFEKIILEYEGILF